MSRSPAPLPDRLPVPFAVASARDLGVSRSRLRAGDLVRPMHGVRSAIEPTTVRERAAALATVLPEDAVFSHHTAATLLRLPTVYADDGMLHVLTPPGCSQVTRAGVVGHRGTASGTAVASGLRVTDAVVTWADLAPYGSVDDCVVFADAVVRRPSYPLSALRAEIDTRHGGRGVRTLREAVRLIRGSDSVMESRARLVMHRCGLPAPQLNSEVFDESGGWLACPDFSWSRLKVAVEYDGDHHRSDRRQWQRDIARRRLLEAAGWRVIVITADDVLRHPQEMVALIRSALAEASGARRPTS